MALSSPNLDDLRFQRDLVDEARKRITQYCPEWTEYNLSDPGITLIELFAWMTELLVYRLNRVPEKNYIKFLELLGMRYQPASSARTDLTFWLSASLPFSEEDDQTVTVPQGLQARTSGGSAEGEIIFSTDYMKEIFPPELVQLRKDTEMQRNYASRLGMEVFLPFMDRPRQGNTFYLGFRPDRDLSGHTLQLTFTCEETEAVGIRRQDPPLVWECSLGDGVWKEVVRSQLAGEKDTTGGLNNPSGSLVFYLPLSAKPDVVHGQNAYWLRCRYEQRNEMQGYYTASPRILSVTPAAIGVTVSSTHSQVVDNEELGRSAGDPGQEFRLQFHPVLSLHEGETLEVQEERLGETVFVPWQYVPNFANSTLHDRHFTLDPASGTVTLGPAIRQPDGTVRQYGRIPENGRLLRFRRYRYGSGANGNVPENSLQSLTSSYAYLARVTNLRRAGGGRDQELLEEVKMRAQRELQAQKRAVTVQDYETLIKNVSRNVARVRCLSPQDEAAIRPGTVELLVIPSVESSLLAGDLGSLQLSNAFVQEAKAFLNQYRLLTTSIQIHEPQYLGVQVCADIVVEDFFVPEVVQARVARCLQQFLSPLALPNLEPELQSLYAPDWEGWTFGRGLLAAEISSLVQRVPGVKYVVDVQLFTRPVDPERERQRVPEIDPQEPLDRLEERVLWIGENTLICSLPHQVNLVDLAAMNRKDGKAHDRR